MPLRVASGESPGIYIKTIHCHLLGIGEILVPHHEYRSQINSCLKLNDNLENKQNFKQNKTCKVVVSCDTLYSLVMMAFAPTEYLNLLQQMKTYLII